MKKLLPILLFSLSFTTTFGQITTTKVEIPVVEKEKILLYDSTENYLDKDLYRYLGQELYVNGLKNESMGYENFVKDYTKESYVGSNIYKCCQPGKNASKYDELFGRYYNIIEVIDHPSGNYGFRGERCYLKLQEKEGKDILYFEHGDDYNSEEKFPFIVVGFFEKQKELLIGNDFVFTDQFLMHYSAKDEGFVPLPNIDTGKEISMKTGQKWTCLDLTILEEDYVLEEEYLLSLLLQNSKGEKIYRPHEFVHKRSDPEMPRYAYTSYEADNYRKKFGDDMFELILQRKIRIGMTKEMCELSWGKPKKINKTINSNTGSNEQWVYYSNYLYFDNNILISMQ